MAGGVMGGTGRTILCSTLIDLGEDRRPVVIDLRVSPLRLVLAILSLAGIAAGLFG